MNPTPNADTASATQSKAGKSAKRSMPSKSRAKTGGKGAGEPDGTTPSPAPIAERSQGSEEDAANRRRMIAEAAYLRAQRRGFERGDPVADWLEAEQEVDQRLRGR